jgi:hypothetical protein
MASRRVSAADAGGSPEARWSRESQRIGGGEALGEGRGDSDDDQRQQEQRRKSDSRWETAAVRITRRGSLDGGTCACKEEGGERVVVGRCCGRREQASETTSRMESGRQKLALRSCCECESSQSGGAAAGVQRRECASSTRAWAQPRMLCFTLVQQQ